MSRFLLLVLGVLAVLVLVRMLRGPSEPDALVAFGTRWEPDQLRHHVFELDRPMALAVTAVGSFEAPAEGAPDALAAYGWVLDRATRDTVWVMTAAGARHVRGTLATVDDTVSFAAGTYDAYFTTFGDPLRPVQEGEGLLDRARAFLRGDRFAWHTDAERWRFRLDPVAPNAVALARLVAAGEAAPAPGDVVWATGPVGSYADSVTYLDVPAAARVWVDATGEVFDEARDYGWLDDLATGERVWTMTRENTAWAGGSVKNRRFRDTLRLEPGRYRLGFHTDASHAFHDWTANPPFDPAAWGLTLGGGGGVVRAVRPFDDFAEIVALQGVGDDAQHEVRFTLTEPTRVLVWGVGEMRAHSRYDYARLLRQPEGAQSGDGADGSRPLSVVWEMEYDESRHAGGTERNRLVEAILDLEAGAYTLRYRTDDSHSPDQWHGAKPTHPGRWGVTVFALDRDFDAATVTGVAYQRGRRASEDFTIDEPPPPPPPPPPPAEPQPLPLDYRRLVNNQRLDVPFVLDAETPVRIAALGEIRGASRYDYAWISRDDDGATVWEMTAENTEEAGGAPHNRRYDGTLTLPAGAYVLHVRTDDSHAYGDFVSAPDDPDAWGILVDAAPGE